uniref:SNARE associated Golgi protein n=2 Tax=Ditylum brightwellii TaxID=49249 RepID=A0A7S4QV15_9STRA|mmetsp:Transcript_37147/g.49285  ORF Transcript_37147/g.49285 Transcript_37147/m.49285 type:complete len:136 (+) Transcript_37147:1021-1428(+)
MILLRLSPLIPYNALDFMSGITSISIASYSIALLGVLPGVVLYTFIGATASTLGDHDGDGMTGGGGGGESQNPLVRKVSLVFGILFAALGVSVAAYHANKELKKILEEEEQQQLEEETRHSLSSSHNEENLPEIT